MSKKKVEYNIVPALVLNMLVLYAVSLATASDWLVVSPETTVIVEPLKSDGKSIDFFLAIKALGEPNVEPEKNGFRKVVKAFGKRVFEPPFSNSKPVDPKTVWQFEETCKLFKLDPVAAPDFDFEPIYGYLTYYDEDENDLYLELDDDGMYLPDDLLDYLITPARSLKEQPKLKDWFEKFGPALDLVRDAVMQEHYYLPMVRRDENELVFQTVPQNAILFHQMFYRCLLLRVRMHFDEGRAEDAWKDYIAAERLFRAADVYGADGMNEPQSRDSRRQQVLLLGCYEKWTPQQLDRMIADLEALRKWDDRKKTVPGIRFLFLDIAASAKDTERFLKTLAAEPQAKRYVPFFSTADIDWNAVARKFNAVIDAHEKTLSEPVPAPVVSETEMRELDMLIKGLPEKIASDMATGSRFGVIGDVVGRLVVVAEKTVYQTQLDEERRCRLLRAAFALERFRQQKKSYPKSLSELRLKPLELPVELKYEKTKQGFTLSNGYEKIVVPNE